MSAESSQNDDIDPAHADEYTHAKMWRHILEKGWQVGSVLGVAVVVPFMMLRYRADVTTAMSWAGRATPAGIILAGVVQAGDSGVLCCRI
jgi:hypothetical protein